MAIAKKTDSEVDILSILKAEGKELKTALNTKATSGFASNEEIIDTLKLKPGSAKVVKSRLSNINIGRSTKGLPKAHHTYFSFNYVILNGEGKGMSVSRYIGLIARGERTKADAAKDISFELQRAGYDTEGLEITDLVDLCKEVTKDKPGVLIKIKCYAVKAGPNKGNLGLDIGAVRPISDEDMEEEESEEEEVEEEESEEEEEEEAPKTSVKKKSSKKVEEVEEEEEESEEEEEESELDIEEPTTWVGHKAICKPAGTPRKATYTVTAFSTKTKKVTVENAAGKEFVVKTTEVLNFVEE